MWTSTRGLGLLVIVVVFTAACAPSSAQPGGPTGDPSPTSPGGSVSSSPTPSSTGPTALMIVLRDGGTTTTWRLTCDPAGGDHPDPTAACAALDAHGATALPPVAKDMMCTQVYGGPETASITGTWRGQTVTSTLSRTNGCEIARWKMLKGLLP